MPKIMSELYETSKPGEKDDEVIDAVKNALKNGDALVVGVISETEKCLCGDPDCKGAFSETYIRHATDKDVAMLCFTMFEKHPVAKAMLLAFMLNGVARGEPKRPRADA